MTHNEVLRRWPALRPWFQGLPQDLWGRYTVRELPENYLVHQKDSPLERVGVLCQGSLRVTSEFDTGNAFMIEYTQPVDFVGDVTVLARREKVSVTIETAAPSAVLFFARRDFETWLDQDPHLVRELSQRVADKLYQSSYSRGKELFYSSPRLLLEYILRFTEGADAERKLPHTRQRLCEELGMSLKTVDRTIQRLREQDFITTKGGKICVTPEQRALIQRRVEDWLD